MRRVAAGDYTSAVCHDDGRVFAVQLNSNTVEVYDPSQSRQLVHSITLDIPPEPYTIKLNVTHSGIYVSSTSHSTVYEFSHTGRLMQQHGRYGKGGAGDLLWPLLCHGDSDGALLVADNGNASLHVLHSDGRWSVVTMSPVSRPYSALHIPGRLYVLTNDNKLQMYLPGGNS